VPEELVEAARIDNASEWKIVTRIMLPIARPTLVTLFMLTFISTWNDYFWPFVLTTNNTVRTLAVGIGAMGQTDNIVRYNLQMAGNVLLILPVILVFLSAQKQIIRAFTYMGDR